MLSDNMHLILRMSDTGNRPAVPLIIGVEILQMVPGRFFVTHQKQTNI